MNIIIFLLFIVSPIFSQDSLRYNHSTKNIDTIVIANEGTHKILVTNEKTFIEKYGSILGAIIGSMIGAFFAALIAFRSIRKTNKNQIKLNEIAHSKQIELENEKIRVAKYQAEKVYCGFLFSIHSILETHDNFLGDLGKELKAILEMVKITGKLPYDKPYNVISLDLLKESYLHVLYYENFNSITVKILVAYISFVENFYNDLNLNNLDKLIKEISNIEESKRIIEDYFNRLSVRITILTEMNDKLKKNILKDLEISDTNNLFTEGQENDSGNSKVNI